MHLDVYFLWKEEIQFRIKSAFYGLWNKFDAGFCYDFSQQNGFAQ